MTKTKTANQLLFRGNRYRLIRSILNEMPEANHDDIEDALHDRINGLFQEMADDGRLPYYWAKNAEHYCFRYEIEQGMYGHAIRERIQFRDEMPESAIVMDL